MSTFIGGTVQQMVDNHVYSIADKIANRYGIPRQELLDLIRTVEYGYGHSQTTKRVQNVVTVAASGAKEINSSNRKHISAYVKFCKKHRPILKQEKPELKFGEISKELGRLWSTLSVSEKSKYDECDTRVEEEHDEHDDDLRSVNDDGEDVDVDGSSRRVKYDTNVLSSSTVDKTGEYTDEYTHEYTHDKLNKKSLIELKNICGKLNLKKTGKKDHLIHQILENVKSTTTTAVGTGVRTKNDKKNINESSSYRENERRDSSNRQDTNQDMEDALVFYEHDSLESSDDVSTTSSSFILDDDDNDLAFEYND